MKATRNLLKTHRKSLRPALDHRGGEIGRPRPRAKHGRIFLPGEPVPETGIYEVIHDRAAETTKGKQNQISPQSAQRAQEKLPEAQSVKGICAKTGFQSTPQHKETRMRPRSPVIRAEHHGSAFKPEKPPGFLTTRLSLHLRDDQHFCGAPSGTRVIFIAATGVSAARCAGGRSGYRFRWRRIPSFS